MKLELALCQTTLLLALLCQRAFLGRALRRGSAQAGSDLRLELSNYKNVQYSAPISLGDQTLPAIYDTGSFEIIVLSNLCTTCAQNHVMYDRTRSTSFASSGGMVVEHLFGSGSVRSEKGYELVHVGNPGSPFAAQHMPFWQVISHKIAVWDENAHFSGIVGLGYPTYVPGGFGQESTSDKTLMAAMGVRSFAFCLERGREEAPGWLVVGPSTDGSAYSSAFQTLKVIGRTHWGVRMSGIRIQGLPSVENPCRPSCGAIVDSGTSLIAVPNAALSAIAPLTQMIKRDCSNLHALPALTLELDGHLVDLPPKAYVMKSKTRVYKNSSIWQALLSGSSYDEVDECSAAFMAIDKVSQHGPVWILGMSFLRHYYTVFDRSAKEIRIARSTPDCQLSSLVGGGFAFANSTAVFTNTTQHGQFTFGANTGMFSATDYQPTQVDLNEARVPQWALATGEQQFQL